MSDWVINRPPTLMDFCSLAVYLMAVASATKIVLRLEIGSNSFPRMLTRITHLLERE